jgi:hypothetical protein
MVSSVSPVAFNSAFSFDFKVLYKPFIKWGVFKYSQRSINLKSVVCMFAKRLEGDSAPLLLESKIVSLCIYCGEHHVVIPSLL